MGLTEYTSDNFSPEYSKALEQLFFILSSKHVLRENVSPEIIKHGNIQLVSKKFSSKNIPSGLFWGWNQVKSRKEISLRTCRVKFFKLTPRNRKKQQLVQPAPKYKLWQYHVIQNDSSQKDFTVLWCQIGQTENSTSTQHTAKRTSDAGPQIMPEINEFSFLAPFMDPFIAMELWPSSFHR